MYKLTEKLIAGTAVSPATHPVLVSLLELAAQRPGIEKGGFPDAASWETFRKRVQASWKRVADAFRAACIAGITDERIIAACPHEGLSFTSADGWKLKPFEPTSYRVRVAALIEKAAGVDLGDALPPGELASVLRAFNRSIVAHRALVKELNRVGYVVYAEGVQCQIKALTNARNAIKSDNQ